MDYEYLNKEHLKGFDNYKYNSVDTSPISVYVMHPFWNRIVEYVPKWVAPNSMTFMGFMLLAGNFLLTCWLDYGYSSSAEPPLPPDGRPVPNWCWLLMGVSLFVAYTLDGIDGKQARRTGSSGPLGELFDHGLDSYAAALVPVCLYSCFGCYDHSISTWRMFLVLWNILVSFYLSHWEKYITGVLFLPWGYDFGMLSSSLVFLATGVYGHTIWKSELPFGYNSGTLFETLIYLTSLACNMPVTLWNIHKAYRDKSGKGYDFMEATRPLWALVVTIALTTFWVAVSPGNILNHDPRAVFLLMGTLFSNVSCRLIVAQMSNTRCEAFNPLLLPLLVSAVLSLAVPRTELALLYAMCLLALASHIHYGTCVVRQMCRHFKVDCFRIKYKK